jgi:outer membrane protein assembly factor BamB
MSLLSFTRRPMIIVALLMSSAIVSAADWPQWRGPGRTGVSSETGLLAAWPAGGPRLVWRVADLGAGYSTPSVAGDHLYVQVNRDLTAEFLQARTVADGRLAWEVRLGKVGNPDMQPPYPGARATPTVSGDAVYALGSDGDLVAVDRRTGRERWRHQLRTDFGGRPGRWAYAESPLVDGDAVIVSPGARTALVALDARTGAERWRSAVPGGEEAAYASTVVATAGAGRPYVQFLEKGLIGVDAATGRLLWRFDAAAAGSAANIPTPVVHEGQVFAGTQMAGGGLLRLAAGSGGAAGTPVYFDKRLGVAQGGAVRIGSHVYAATGQGVQAIDWATGRIAWQARGIGTASLTAADGRLYLHGENGDVALVEATPAGYQERGRFTPANRPDLGSAKAWAHPVVANGRLYLRQAGVLWAYDVAAPRPSARAGN